MRVNYYLSCDERKTIELFREDISIPRDIRDGDWLEIPGIITEYGCCEDLMILGQTECEKLIWIWDSVRSEWNVNIGSYDYRGVKAHDCFDKHLQHAIANGWKVVGE